MAKDKLFAVGLFHLAYNRYLTSPLPVGMIYQSTGLRRHVQKRHPAELKTLDRIPEILAAPDYIGQNPNEPNTVEFVKRMGRHVMVCVKLDTERQYLYVASIFPITDGKLRNRLNSGRLKPVEAAEKGLTRRKTVVK